MNLPNLLSLARILMVHSLRVVYSCQLNLILQVFGQFVRQSNELVLCKLAVLALRVIKHGKRRLLRRDHVMSISAPVDLLNIRLLVEEIRHIQIKIRCVNLRLREAELWMATKVLGGLESFLIARVRVPQQNGTDSPDG